MEKNITDAVSVLKSERDKERDGRGPSFYEENHSLGEWFKKA